MNIGEASKQSGVSERMIRHYEKIGLIPAPPRRGAGYRDYGARDLHRLRFIANARDLGFPIEEIRTLLGLWADIGRASSEVKTLALARAEELQRKAEALTSLRNTGASHKTGTDIRSHDCHPRRWPSLLLRWPRDQRSH
ncbi:MULTISPECIES: MerR family transcriptional regulator [Sphingomonadaceae]|uniref:MerR family transcriptional regulator n=1 Tax=Sphingobium yanoikuyae TaxID=13690 RepID=A0A6P1GDP9_SPHYA|nr:MULTISPECIES: MerR family transcriptional regulator [Sphingomonadaceae]QHD66615.1 MerR family transcriptional regulator [Sphingobium yanoikuyae]QNG48382.1 MerR family transcriptional regulator [Sphingobium yanoikuyae]WQE08942.1 MerR family transcriptional regulator [Sphingobium yanoikuyae]